MRTMPVERPPRTRRTAMAQEAVILAGGKGVRLRPYTTLIPKPLVPIGEQHSILEVVVRQLARQRFKRATLAIGHFGQIVRAYVGNGSQWGLQIDYVSEESPLGTMGPVLMILDRLPEHFIVMNGDILTDIDYADLLDTHVKSGAPLTVATYEREHRVDFGVLDLKNRSITGFQEKPVMKYSVSMGVYAVSRAAMRRFQPGLPLGFDEIMLDLIERGTPPAAYPFAGYWLDIGRPDDYDRANQEFTLLKEHFLPGV